MAEALIKIDQPGGAGAGVAGKSVDTIVKDVVVELRNADNTGVVYHSWTLLDKPRRSTATIADPQAPVTTIVPDLAGTYRVRLFVNDGRDRGRMQDVRTFIVRDPAGFRPPAHLEGPLESNFPLETPGTFNEVGALDEIRRRMEANDNRDDPLVLEIPGGADEDIEFDWYQVDALVVWMELASFAATDLRIRIYANAGLSPALYDQNTINAVGGWFENIPRVIAQCDGKVYIKITNNAGAPAAVTFAWRVQAL